MRDLASSWRALVVFGLVAACGDAKGRPDFEQAPPAAASPAPTTDPGDLTNGATGNPPKAEPPAPSEVFGHSADTLYRLDPETKAVTVVGPLAGCEHVVDIALDATSRLFATSRTALYEVDRKTARCTLRGKGAYPNSLSFVPKGTVDPTTEALVGYDDATYLRIDPATGKRTVLGQLGETFVSSGDIVSVIGGATYLTVKGSPACDAADCLVEVDPVNGRVLKNHGSIGHDDVFGLSFWAGKLYGFDRLGELFEITLGGSAPTTSLIEIPARPAELSFWGAGSTTSAPLAPRPK